MSALDTKCPPEAVLSDFGLGKLDAASAEAVSRHIETCTDCRHRVSSISGDSFVGRLRQAGGTAKPVKRERTYVPGESLANAANSTDGREDGLPRPSRRARDQTSRDGLGSPSSVSAPSELANHPDYELIKELGQGGMGTVYLAKNRMMDRLEVLKVISKSLLTKPGALERFQQEIRSAAKLQHPNIVAAYSVLRPGDLLVFAMEHVQGQDLEKVVNARGYLPVANAAFYIHHVANGLQHAFEKGMVHRDIKPNNLMLAIDGKKHIVKILDFGLAKASSEKGAEGGLTKSGQMLGTPDFIAPEQTLDAQKADIRADIYSLGCTLYFLLAGHPPFQAPSLYELLEAHHTRDAKALNLVRPDVPVELAAIVARMMAKDPAKRYQTPIEVAKALVPFFKPGQSVAPPPSGQPPSGDVYPQYTMETVARPASATPPPVAGPPAPVSLPLAPVPLRAAPAAVAATRPAGEEFSVAINVNRPAIRSRNNWSSSPSWQRLGIAAGGVACVLLFGIVLLVHTPRGTIQIAFSDPKAEVTVTVDGNQLDIAGLDAPLTLDVGEHGLIVKGAGYETVTRSFNVTRGDNVLLRIRLIPVNVASKGNQPTSDGFVPLFNGKDLSGWKTHPSRQGMWRVESGVLIGSGPATSYLFTGRGNFTNFHLRAEVRINDGGNSGVFARSPLSADPWIDGYEAQINSTARDKNRTGSLYTKREAVTAVMAAPVEPNEWFSLELVAIDNHIIVKVNGRTTADYRDDARRFTMGHIALQQHDPLTVVQFRTIEIKELRGAADAKTAQVPDDATEFGDHWYKFYQEQLSWKAAHGRCQALGGRLVVIDSLAENAFVGGLVEKAAWQDAWIGATDESEEGKWRDGDGKLLSFTNWLPLGNQPNNKNHEEHFALISNRTVARTPINWRWADQPNESREHQPGFVCEWETKAIAGGALRPAVSSTNPLALSAAPFDGEQARMHQEAWAKHLGEAPSLASNAFSAGSSWKGNRVYRHGAYSPSAVVYELHVRERDGAKFKGHVFDNGPGRNRAEVEGEIVGKTIRWRERALHVENLMTMEGTLVGDRITLTFKGTYPNGATNDGDDELKLEPTEAPNQVSREPPLAVAPFDATEARVHQEAWAKHLGVPIEQTNSIGMKLTWIPPGEFMMGSTPEEIEAALKSTSDRGLQGWYRGEAPRHRVTLTKPFYLGAYEVTQAQYKELMGVNPSHFAPGKPGESAVKGLDVNRHPVDTVSWPDAIEFCNKLSVKEGLPAFYARDGGNVTLLGTTGYRLPNEAEWEYACRAGSAGRWSFGDDEADLPKHAWFAPNSGGRPHAVGELKPNAFGLYDMHGNCTEWVWDLFGGYSASDATDPMGAAASAGRMARGGTFISPLFEVRSAGRRESAVPGYKANFNTFRVARTVVPRGAADPAGNTSQPVRDADAVGKPLRRADLNRALDATDEKGTPPAPKTSKTSVKKTITLGCSFRNDTQSDVSFFLGDNFYELAPGKLQGYRGTFEVGAARIVRIVQANGEQMAYTLTNRGKYAFKLNPKTKKIENHYR